MQYTILGILASIVSFGIGYLVSRKIIKDKDAKHRKIKRFAISFTIGLVLLVIEVLVVFSVHYSPDNSAKEALNGNDIVEVSNVKGGYFFDGPSSDKAIIFYAGAKVDPTSYAPLMLRLAEEGFDCFLANMTLYFPLINQDAADKFINNYTYDTWIMAGHSLGGIISAFYANEHAESVDGIILLAAYSTDKINDKFKLCSIYGSEDGCLEMDVYEQCKLNWTKDVKEVVIQGGNHSQFGCYGLQDGDGVPTISQTEQMDATVDAISSFF